MLDEAFTFELREVTGHTPEVNKCYRNINLTRQVENAVVLARQTCMDINGWPDAGTLLR